MHHCPQLAPQAYALANQRIKGTNLSSTSTSNPSNTSTTTSPSTPYFPDPTLHRTAVQIYNSLSSGESGQKQKSVDAKWVEQVQTKNAREKSKLETELKTYQSNLIKESIRVSGVCRWFFCFFLVAGVGCVGVDELVDRLN
jgi:hypothetical protein